MIPAIRQETILELLKSSNTILHLDDLRQKLNISSSTLRRDLRELSANQQVVLLHGGGVKIASADNTNIEMNISTKLLINKSAKQKIAKAAASQVANGDVIFLDPSSTTFEMIPFLPHDITVVTNGIVHINQLVANNIPSVMVGGNIKPATNSCIGPMAESTMKEYHFTRAFLGSNGFSKSAGITNHDINECIIKQIALRNSKQTYFLLDSSKYNVVTMVRIVDMAIPNIITDKYFPDFFDFPNIQVIE